MDCDPLVLHLLGHHKKYNTQALNNGNKQNGQPLPLTTIKQSLSWRTEERGELLLWHVLIKYNGGFVRQKHLLRNANLDKYEFHQDHLLHL